MINVDKTSVLIFQTSYIEKIFEHISKVFLRNLNHQFLLPIAKGYVFSKLQAPRNISDAEKIKKKNPYTSLHITYVINIFSQFQENHSLIHSKTFELC